MPAPAGPPRHPRRRPAADRGQPRRQRAGHARGDVIVPRRAGAASGRRSRRRRGHRQPGRRTGPRDHRADTNSFLNCCLDLSRVGRFLVLDTGLSAHDRAQAAAALRVPRICRLQPRRRARRAARAAPRSDPRTVLAAPGPGLAVLCAREFHHPPDRGARIRTTGIPGGHQLRRCGQADRRLRGRAGGAPRTRRRPLRPDRCGGQRPGDVRHRTPRSGRQHRGQRPRSHRRTRSAGGRCRTTHRQPRRGALHRRSPTTAATQSPGTGREEGRSPTRKATQNPGTGREKGRSPTRKATQNPGTGREKGRSPTRKATQSPGTGCEEGTSAENTSSVTRSRPGDVR